jgi:hypothetical protein
MCDICFLTLKEEHRLRMMNAVFWDMMPCGFNKNLRFKGTSPSYSGGEDSVSPKRRFLLEPDCVLS